MSQESANDYTPRTTPPPADAVLRVAALWGGQWAPVLLHSGKPGEMHGGAQFCVIDGEVRDIAHALHGLRRWTYTDAIPGLLYQFLSPTGGVLPWSAVDAPAEPAPREVAPAEPPIGPPGVALYDLVSTVHARVHRAVIATSANDARTAFDPVELTWSINSVNAETAIESVTRVTPAQIAQTFLDDERDDSPSVTYTRAAADVFTAIDREDLCDDDLSLDDVRDLVGEDL